jgi:hypothetical protein
MRMRVPIREHFSSWRKTLRERVLIIGALLALALVAASSGTVSHQYVAVSTLEARFTDMSADGMQIVPASCPSDPHFAGDCTPPPPPPVCKPSGVWHCVADSMYDSCNNFLASCSATYGPTYSCQAGGATGAQCYNTALPPKCTPSYTCNYDGSSLTVNADCTTSQTGVGTCTYTPPILVCAAITPFCYGPNNDIVVYDSCWNNYHCTGGQTCSAGKCVGAPPPPPVCTPTGTLHCDGNVVQNSCNVTQRDCTDTGQICSGAGVCTFLPAPAPVVTLWSLKPRLVHSGGTVQIIWQTSNVTSCQVRGSNGDGPWTDLSATKTSRPIVEQTIYTLVCQGLAGSTPTSVATSGTVNIAPIFQER